jgi:hypothetical protein
MCTVYRHVTLGVQLTLCASQPMVDSTYMVLIPLPLPLRRREGRDKKFDHVIYPLLHIIDV